jgi:multidrug resistance protein, MATE family
LIISKPKIKELFIFALPIIIGQLGQMFISAGDVWVAGKHSTLAVASIGVANGIVGPIIMVGMGILMGIAPILSNRRGKGEDVHHHFFDSLVFSLMVALPCVAFCYLASLCTDLFGFNAEVVPYVKEYLQIVSFSFIGASMYLGMKEYLQSFENTMFANALSIFSIIVNLILNYLFVFGLFGFPKLGIAGLAFASLGVRTFMGIVLTIYAYKISIFERKLSMTYFKEVIKLGSPIAFTILLEVSAFSIVTLLIGRMSAIQSASHNIILTLASTTFMIPLAMSSAVSVKVGHAFGQKNKLAVKEYASSALIISLGFMVLSALCFTVFPKEFTGFFTTDQEVIDVSVKLLFVVALFQLFDGVQVTLSGVLRGLNISKPIFISAIVGYWLLGMPIGFYLAFSGGMQSLGLWIGLAISLLCVAVILSFITHRRMESI